MGVLMADDFVRHALCVVAFNYLASFAVTALLAEKTNSR
jgi:hypothetical protein